MYLASGLTLLAISALQPAKLWPLLIPLFICIASLGCIIPNASACAMNGQGARAGSASALLGCIQFSVAAGAAALVGVLHDGSAVPMALVISLCGLGRLRWRRPSVGYSSADPFERVRRLQAGLQGVDEGAGFGLAAKVHNLLVQPNLPWAAGFLG